MNLTSYIVLESATMRLGCISILALLFVCGFAATTAADDIDAVEVQVDVARDTIGMDEVGMLQVVVSGSDRNLPPPRLPGLSMFDVYSQGQSTNISIVNGKVEASVTYRYQLVPKKPGSFKVSGIAVVHRNRRFVGNEITITVLDRGQAQTPKLSDKAVDAAGNSRDYFLLSEVDKENPYVNEQVTLTLKFCVAVQLYNRPELTAPSTTGFWTELLGNKPSYTQVINGRTYQVMEIKYALFPTQTGELTIGRAMIRSTIASRSQTQRRSIFDDLFRSGQEITVRSRPIAIDVKPLPEQGRPVDFTGTIGNFSISATADKTQSEVNEPITVKVQIRGEGNIKSVAEPTIGDLPDFRVYRASSSEKTSHANDRLGGTKEFEEVYIPRRPGELTIPTLTLTYFNPRSGKYERKNTRPITVAVAAGEDFAGGVDLPYIPSGISIGSEASDIRFIKSDIGDLRPVRSVVLTRPSYLLVNGLPVVVFLTLWAYRTRRQRLSRETALLRSRGASKIARKRLATARGMADADKAEAFYWELTHAVTSYIADKINVSPHGLTSETIAQHLSEKSASAELVASVADFLKRCDFARYAPTTVDQEQVADDLQRAEDVMVQLEKVKLA